MINFFNFIFSIIIFLFLTSCWGSYENTLSYNSYFNKDNINCKEENFYPYYLVRNKIGILMPPFINVIVVYFNSGNYILTVAMGNYTEDNKTKCKNTKDYIYPNEIKVYKIILYEKDSILKMIDNEEILKFKPYLPYKSFSSPASCISIPNFISKKTIKKKSI